MSVKEGLKEKNIQKINVIKKHSEMKNLSHSLRKVKKVHIFIIQSFIF